MREGSLFTVTFPSAAVTVTGKAWPLVAAAGGAELAVPPLDEQPAMAAEAAAASTMSLMRKRRTLLARAGIVWRGRSRPGLGPRRRDPLAGPSQLRDSAGMARMGGLHRLRYLTRVTKWGQRECAVTWPL
jgi:hypothetical protein